MGECARMGRTKRDAGGQGARGTGAGYAPSWRGGPQDGPYAAPDVAEKSQTSMVREDQSLCVKS